MPIKTYNVVQTGAKIQFGGLKKGLFNPAYQVGMAGVVASEPIAPINKQAIIANASFNKFFTNLILPTYKAYVN